MRPSLVKRTALVTGGTAGIGLEIARALVRAGTRVIVAGSDPQRGERAVDELRREEAGAVEFLQADLSLVREVDRLAAVVVGQFPRLDYLVLCAGVVRARRLLTSENIESNFAIGYLSRFVLTAALLPLLQEARILVISGAARNGRIHYEDVNLTRDFGTLRAVAQLCEANDVFVLEQARRLPAEAAIMALKVGVVRTGIRRDFPLWMKLLVPLIDPVLAQTPQRVAEEALRLLTSPAFSQANGALFLFVRRFQLWMADSRTTDPAEGRRLWDLSARLVAEARSVRDRQCPAR